MVRCPQEGEEALDPEKNGHSESPTSSWERKVPQREDLVTGASITADC